MSRNEFHGPSELQTVTVLETRNYGLIIIAKSLLEEADIEYWTSGEPLQTAIPGIDPVQFWVRAEDAEEARKVLQACE